MESATLIAELVTALTQGDPLEVFPLEEVCNILDCDGATFWHIDPYEDKVFVLKAAFNRPDLDEKYDEYEFRLQDSFLWPEAKSNETHFKIVMSAEMQKLKWANRELKTYAIENYKCAVFLLLKDSEMEVIGLVSLYYKNDNADLNHHVLGLTPLVFGNILECLTRIKEKLIVNRRKIGHEIARTLKQSLAKIDRIEKHTKSNLSVQASLDDLRRTTNAAIETAAKPNFRDGLLDRRTSARFLQLRGLVVGICHRCALEFRIPYTTVASNSISGGLQVLMAETDADLLFSNVLENAFKYCVKGGFLIISSKEIGNKFYEICISNASEPIDAGEIEFLWRFGNRGGNSEGLEGEGIGLSIVAEICDVYDIKVTFAQRQSLTTLWTDFTLLFPKNMFRITERAHKGLG